MGALAYYITHCDESNFQPMKANFGILPDLPVRVKKKLRKEVNYNWAQYAIAEAYTCRPIPFKLSMLHIPSYVSTLQRKLR